MKKKYQVTLVIIGCLIVLIGLSYAYFLATSKTEGNGGSVTVQTVTLDNIGFNIEGILEFNDLDIYPGHKNISKIRVTALGNNDTINYKLVWEGINTLNTPLKYYVYKTTSSEEPSITCKKEIEIIGASKHYYETCTNNNFNNLGNIIKEGEITKATEQQEFVLSPDEVIKGTEEGNVVYYYVILEYPNLEENQNIDMGGKFEGIVTVKKDEDLLADITIKKMYKEIENGYEEITTMPSEGYIINEEKSTCTNNATPTLKNNKVLVKNLNTSGTECNIYFDIKNYKTIDEIIPTLNVKTEQPDFSKVATTDEGVFAVSDGMYGGTSYYWRGAATTNYLKFANFCWRIIRINGDKTIRLIYDGTTCHQNGESTTDNIVVPDVAYNIKGDRSEYVGWTYVEGKQRPEAGDAPIDSNAKLETEKWYNTNLKLYENKIANGKYCNDRDVQSGNIWVTTGARFNYAGNDRLYKYYTPVLECNEKDIYTLKIGAITADEVELAGGNNEKNELYYLRSGKHYWSMTSYQWNVNTTRVFYVNSNGILDNPSVNWTTGSLRPVINLRSDIQLTGEGTIDNPYVVKGTE